MSDIQQYNFGNDSDKNKLKEMFAKLFHLESFVPFLDLDLQKVWKREMEWYHQ